MRAFPLLAASLFSCTFLVGKLNPCLNGDADAGAFCFEKGASLQASGLVIQLKSGDINGDGRQDLVALIDNGGLFLEVLLQNSLGGFDRIESPQTSSVNSVVIANLKRSAGDTKDSILALNNAHVTIMDESNGLLLGTDFDLVALSNDPVFSGNPRAITVGQFDPGGPLELAVAFLSADLGVGRAHVFPITEDGIGVSSFNTGLINGTPCDVPDVSAVIDIEAQDFDRDADDEFVLLVNSAVGNIRQAVLFENQSPEACVQTRNDLTTFGTPATIQNLDQNPSLEFAFSADFTALHTLQIFGPSRENPLALEEIALLPLRAAYQTSSAADVDGDGLKDVVVAVGDKVDFFHQVSNGEFIPTEVFLPVSPAEFREGMLADDINGDGVDDVLVAGDAGLIEVFLSRP
jgi:hypothetical protein